MGTVFFVMQALCIALKLKQGETARANELADWMFMLLTCGFSGKLESVTNTMWFLAPLKIMRHAHALSVYALFVLEVVEVNYSSFSCLRFWSCTQCLLSGCPEPCFFLNVFPISVLLLCTPASSLCLCTWSRHNLTTRPARTLAKLDIVKYTLFPWWRMRNSLL